MIREAKFIDLPLIRELAKEMHSVSKYSDRCSLNIKLFNKLCLNAIHSPKGCVYVDDQVSGFIIGAIEPVYGVSDKYYASDIFFYSPHNPKVSNQLLNAFIAWAEQQPKVIEICCGINNAIGNDFQRKSKLYERKGFQIEGTMLVKDIL